MVTVVASNCPDDLVDLDPLLPGLPERIAVLARSIYTTVTLSPTMTCHNLAGWPFSVIVALRRTLKAWPSMLIFCLDGHKTVTCPLMVWVMSLRSVTTVAPLLLLLRANPEVDRLAVNTRAINNVIGILIGLLSFLFVAGNSSAGPPNRTA